MSGGREEERGAELGPCKPLCCHYGRWSGNGVGSQRSPAAVAAPLNREGPMSFSFEVIPPVWKWGKEVRAKPVGEGDLGEGGTSGVPGSPVKHPVPRGSPVDEHPTPPGFPSKPSGLSRCLSVVWRPNNNFVKGKNVRRIHST